MSLKSISFRSQRTIERWNIEHSGKADHSHSDVEWRWGRERQHGCDISVAFCTRAKGDNYEGIRCFAPSMVHGSGKTNSWSCFRRRYWEVRNPDPVLTVPPGKEGKPWIQVSRENAKVLWEWSSKLYHLRRDGWKLEFNNVTLIQTRSKSDQCREPRDGEFHWHSFLLLGQTERDLLRFHQSFLISSNETIRTWPTTSPKFSQKRIMKPKFKWTSVMFRCS